MFRRFTDRVTSAASSVMGSGDHHKVRTLTSMGFPEAQASNALNACNGDLDRAAELLLAERAARDDQQQAVIDLTGDNDDEDEALRRVMQESLEMEEKRRAKQTTSSSNAARSASVHKAGEAAALRAAGVKTATATKKRSTSGGLSTHHPDVKVIPKLQDKTKEEQVLRCADRLKNSPQAVETLYRALTTIQNNPENAKFRKIDKQNAAVQRLLTAPGAEDLLRAMNFRSHQNNNALVLDRVLVDPALLYLGISALEQTKLTEEYKQAKQKADFCRTLRDILNNTNNVVDSEEAAKRATYMAKCPVEPADGLGALMQVTLGDETVPRRFDGDDTLADVLNWLGGQYSSTIPENILNTRQWCLVDLHHYPIEPIDCNTNEHRTLQYIGCWPSGRLEVLPSSEEWMKGGRGATAPANRGSSRGLGSAPRDAL